MLNKLIENGLDKCFLYWPVKDTKLKFDDTGLEVEPISEKASDNSDFVIREFKLKNLKVNINSMNDLNKWSKIFFF